MKRFIPCLRAGIASLLIAQNVLVPLPSNAQSEQEGRLYFSSCRMGECNDGYILSQKALREHSAPNGRQEILYEVKKRFFGSRSGDTQSTSWVFCSVRAPYVASAYSDDEIGFLELIPAMSPPTATREQHMLYWAVCHEQWESTDGGDRATGLGYEPSSVGEREHHRLWTRSEFLQFLRLE
jgi:hypothetical protein